MLVARLPQSAAASAWYGFVYSHGIYTTIDNPLAGSAARQGTEILGINNSRQVVGVYIDATGHEHGFIATPTVGHGAHMLISTCYKHLGTVSAENNRKVLGEVIKRFAVRPAFPSKIAVTKVSERD